jgi:PAS domain S-box-containing protein
MDTYQEIINEYNFLMKALNGLNVIIYINEVDRNGNNKLVWANNKYPDFTGFTFEERQKLGDKYYELYYHPDDYPNTIKIIRDVAEGKIDSYSISYRIKHRNGNWVWIYSKGNIFDEDKEKGIRKCISIGIDMTDRIVQNEEQLDVLLKEIARLRNKALIVKITKTEKGTIKYLVNGMTTKQVAKHKNRSYDTINNHKRNIFKKLNLHNIAELVAFAKETGLD